jgi:hypothetical protein
VHLIDKLSKTAFVDLNVSSVLIEIALEICIVRNVLSYQTTSRMCRKFKNTVVSSSKDLNASVSPSRAVSDLATREP